MDGLSEPIRSDEMGATRRPLVLSPGETLIEDVPFFSQHPGDDHDFPNAELAAYWRLRGCGIACLRMVIAGAAADPVVNSSYWSLVKEGLDRGMYNDRGWIHQGLVEMAQDYGVAGSSRRRTTIVEVAGDVQSGRLVIASVTLCFRGGQKKPSGGTYEKGGHLVVVNGADVDEKQRVRRLRVHHPSASLHNNWQSRWITVEAFERSFSSTHMAFERPRVIP